MATTRLSNGTAGGALATLAPVATPHPSRPEVLFGLRAAIVTVLPIIVGELTGHAWIAGLALGGWLGSMADPGGAYATRARAIVAFIVGGAGAMLIGSLLTGPAWLVALLTFLVIVVIAMLRVYGDVGATLSTLLAVVFCAALGAPAHDLGSALRAAAELAGGGALAALLALSVWPVRQDWPARAALADAYRSLAAFARAMAEALRAPPSDDAWHEIADTWPGAVRRAVERARATLGEARARRLGRSETGDLLAELFGTAERTFGTLIAASEELASVALTMPDERARVGAARVLERLDGVLQLIAARLAPPGASLRVAREPAGTAREEEGLDLSVLSLWSVLDEDHAAIEKSDALALVALSHLARAAALLEEAATDAQMALDLATAAREDGWREHSAGRARDASSARAEMDASRPGRAAAPQRASARDRWWHPLRANLSWSSLMLRHALRLGAATAVAIWITRRFSLDHGLWVTTTVVLLLQPNAGVTLARGVLRVIGTVAGGIVAALLAALLHQPLAVALVMFPLAVAAAAARRMHYALFTFFLTPVFVLMAEHSMGDWRLALIRIGSTLAGAVLALLASRLLWPTFEHERLPGQFSDLLGALRDYYRAVAAPLLGREAPRSAEEERRRLGLASNNAEAAVQRFVGEPRGRWSDVETLATFLSNVRRLNGAMVALSASLGVAGAWDEGTIETARAVDATLADLSLSVSAGRRPEPLPPPLVPLAHTGEHAILSHAHLAAHEGDSTAAVAEVPMARVARAVRRLHRAADRMAQV